MRYHFPRTLKAAEASERSQWAVGDALLVEAEDRHNGPRGLAAVSKELEANGISLSTSYLSALRTTAANFKPQRRHVLPWKVHEAAGNPDTLDVIVRSAKKTGAKVTIWYVADVLKQLRDADKEERQKVKAEAETLKAAAEAEERKAREAERVAYTAAERAHAERQRIAATKRTREAIKQVKAAKTMPKKRDQRPPVEEEVPMMVLTTTLMSAASEVDHRAAQTERDLAKHIGELSPKMISALIESWMSATNTCTRIVATLRKAAPKGAHLSVVNE